MKEAFGDRLRSALDEAGATQASLAKRIGVSKGLVSQWMAGTKDCPTDRVEAIAEALGADLGFLLGQLEEVARPFEAHWYFRETTDQGRDYGNSNVFATPSDIATLVREAGQNSADQSLHGRVHIRFELIKLTAGSEARAQFFRLIQFDELSLHIEAAGRTRSRLGRKLKAGLARIKDESAVYLLRIDDFGTTGLSGEEWSVGDEVNPFAALVRNNLDSSKMTDTSGGSYGLGKAPLWRSSDAATVLVSSKLGRGVAGHEGKIRLSGKVEATWHHLDEGKESFAGPGWLGGHQGDSLWVDPASLGPLFLDRRNLPAGIQESEASGTSILIVGFRDSHAEGELDPTKVLDEIRTAAAENFWPAIVAGSMSFSTVHSVDGVRKSEEEIDLTETHTAPFVEGMNAFLSGEVTTEPEPGETAAATVTLEVPATLSTAEAVPRGSPAVDSSCKLIVRLARPEDLVSRFDSHVALVRGQRMVVRYWSRANILVGQRPFHAILLAGTAVGESEALEAAERFLRLAEPPAHDKWEYREDLRDNYARGSGARLRELEEDVTRALRELIRPDEDSTDEEPEALKRVLALSLPAKPPFPVRLRSVDSQLDGRRWKVEGEIKILDRREPLVIHLDLGIRPESGATQPVGWSEFELLKVNRGSAEIVGDGVIRVAPKTTSLVFGAESEPGPDGLDLERCLAQVSVRALRVRREAKAEKEA